MAIFLESWLEIVSILTCDVVASFPSIDTALESNGQVIVLHKRNTNDYFLLFIAAVIPTGYSWSSVH